MKPKNFPARVRQRRLEAAARMQEQIDSLVTVGFNTSVRKQILKNTLAAVERSGTRSTRSKKNREEKAR